MTQWTDFQKHFLQGRNKKWLATSAVRNISHLSPTSCILFGSKNIPINNRKLNISKSTGTSCSERKAPSTGTLETGITGQDKTRLAVKDIITDRKHSLTDSELKKIAAEFNLSETAFPVPTDPSLDYKTSSSFSLRWFTPTNEVPLCGHATLATSHVLFNEIGNVNNELKFETKSGVLTVKKNEEGSVEMNFPKYELMALKIDDLINQAEGGLPESKAPDFVMDVIQCLVPNKITIESVVHAPSIGFIIVSLDSNLTKSEFEALKLDVSRALELHDGSFFRGLAITLRPSNPIAQGFSDAHKEPYDYACRYFGPWDGVNEDPATGSAQCTIGPFWEKMTGKKELYGFQAFPGRGAQFRLKLQEDRVVLTGSSLTVVRGEIIYH